MQMLPRSLNPNLVAGEFPSQEFLMDFLSSSWLRWAVLWPVAKGTPWVLGPKGAPYAPYGPHGGKLHHSAAWSSAPRWAGLGSAGLGLAWLDLVGFWLES